MPDTIDRLLVELGYNTEAMEKDAREAIRKTTNLAQSIAQEGQKGGALMGEGIAHGIKSNLKNLKKEAGFLASGVGAFMGSEMAHGFKDSWKGAIGGAMGGLIAGSSFGPWGGAIGAVVGAGMSILTQATYEAAEQQKAFKQLAADFEANVDSIRQVVKTIGEEPDAFGKRLENWKKLLEELQKGTPEVVELFKQLGVAADKVHDPLSLNKQALVGAGSQLNIEQILEQLDLANQKGEELNANTRAAMRWTAVAGGMPGMIPTQEKKSLTGADIDKQLEALAKTNPNSAQTLAMAIKKGWGTTENLASDFMKLGTINMKPSVLGDLATQGEDRAREAQQANKEAFEAMEDQFEIAKQLNKQDEQRAAALEKQQRLLKEQSDEIQKQKDLERQRDETLAQQSDRMGAKWSLKDLAALSPRRRLKITGPWTRQGAMNIETAADIDEMENYWAPRYSLEGRTDLARVVKSRAHLMRLNLPEAFRHDELDVLKEMNDRIDYLNTQIQNGLRIRNGQ